MRRLEQEGTVVLETRVHSDGHIPRFDMFQALAEYPEDQLLELLEQNADWQIVRRLILEKARYTSVADFKKDLKQAGSRKQLLNFIRSGMAEQGPQCHGHWCHHFADHAREGRDTPDGPDCTSEHNEPRPWRRIHKSVSRQFLLIYFGTGRLEWRARPSLWVPAPHTRCSRILHGLCSEVSNGWGEQVALTVWVAKTMRCAKCCLICSNKSAYQFARYSCRPRYGNKSNAACTRKRLILLSHWTRRITGVTMMWGRSGTFASTPLNLRPSA